MQRGLDDEDEPVSEITDRAFWEKERASVATVAIADKIFEMCRSFSPKLVQSYKKNYIGFRLENRPFNFAVCKPRPKSMRLEINLPKSDEIDAELENTALDVLTYNRHFGMYRLSIKASDVETQKECLRSLLKRAYDSRV